jgi:hypothetical protein
MADPNYYRSFIALTGGGTGALDKYDGVALKDGDPAVGIYDGKLYAYKLNATSGAAESSPSIIAPDTNAGDKRWILQSPYGQLILGETSADAYRGDRGKTAYDHSQTAHVPTVGTAANSFLVSGGDPYTYAEKTIADTRTLVVESVRVGAVIHGVDAKTTMHDNDKIGIIDTEASNVLKTLSWAYVKSILKTYIDAMTSTFTNKRITARITTITSAGEPTINTDNCDAVTITALAAAITSMTTNLSGTPTNFQKLIIRIKDNGTARAIAWGASFEAKGVALPTTTVISKVLTVGFIYDTVTSKWGCIASAQEA